MKHMGAFEAKTHFAQLLDMVEAGEEVSITRRGKEVARLVPTESARQARRDAAFEMARRMREALRTEGKTWTLDDILSVKHEGHRF